MDANEAGGFEDALEEADGHDLVGVVGETCSEGEEAPAGAGEREPDARWDLLHDEVIGNLAEEVAPIEDCVNLIELGPFEVEVFFCSRDVCVVEIGAV